VTTHPDPLTPWRHEHCYLGSNHDRNAGRTRLVMALTAVTMVVEIIAGGLFGSTQRITQRFRPWAECGITAVTVHTDQDEAVELMAKLV